MTHDDRIAAIETRYAGCHFRSRLEARWAVLFDELGIKWEYEPQGFEWPASVVDDFGDDYVIEASRYLPDFWLPDIKTWFEVKGPRPTDAESTTHRNFALLMRQRHICAWGGIPAVLSADNGGWVGDEYDTSTTLGMELDGGNDFHYMLCVCPKCGRPGIEFDGRGGRICRHDADDKGYTFNDERIVAACAAARSARFEHGQSGAS